MWNLPAEDRFYRHLMGGPDLTWFVVGDGESDLWVAVDTRSWRPELRGLAAEVLHRTRRALTRYLVRHPQFGVSHVPVEVQTAAPPLVREMAAAARIAGVGPMAAVAGAIAEEVGKALLPHVQELLVENGGDVILWGSCPRRVAILAGVSPLSLRVGLLVTPQNGLTAVCTSAGRWGHSYSQGRADAAVAVASSGAIADAVATQLGNMIRDGRDLETAVRATSQRPGIIGLVAIRDDRLAAWGKLRLIRIGE